MSHNPRLLPAPDLPSPNKTFVFKTPPNSSDKSNNLKNSSGSSTTTNIYSDGSGNNVLLKQGLLSPELSSPQIGDYIPASSTPLTKLFNAANNARIANSVVLSPLGGRGRSMLNAGILPPIDGINSLIQNRPSNRSLDAIASNKSIRSSQEKQFDEPDFSKPPPVPEFSKAHSYTKKNESHSSKRSKKQKGPQITVVPKPEDMPPVIFTSDLKPPYSYATLIGMALLRSPTRQLTLSQIYRWISTHFAYYRKDQLGWQNSIRHNLSLNKSFTKAEKSKDGKGHYWRIVSGYEYQFCNVKESRRSATSESRKRPRSSNKKKSHSRKAKRRLTTKKDNDSTIHECRLPPIASLDKSSASPRGILSRTPVKLGSIPEMSAPSHYMFRSYMRSPDGSYYQESPNSLPFTSSFNSKSTFDLSPLKGADVGPIMEPLTPRKQTPNTSLSKAQQEDILGSKYKTPLNTMQTPLINIGSSSVIRKLWASPSYLDDFYTSPVANTDTDSTDSVIYKSIYGSPLAIKSQRNKVGTNATATTISSNSSSGSNNGKSKSIKGKSDGSGYTTNQIFGIDIGSFGREDDRLR